MYMVLEVIKCKTRYSMGMVYSVTSGPSVKDVRTFLAYFDQPHSPCPQVYTFG